MQRRSLTIHCTCSELNVGLEILGFIPCPSSISKSRSCALGWCLGSLKMASRPFNDSAGSSACCGQWVVFANADDQGLVHHRLNAVTIWKQRKRDERSVQFSRRQASNYLLRVAVLRMNAALRKQVTVGSRTPSQITWCSMNGVKPSRNGRIVAWWIACTALTTSIRVWSNSRGESEQRFAGGSEGHSAMIPFKYLDVNGIFKLVDLTAKSGLSQCNARRSGSDCALFRNCDNALEVFELKVIVDTHGHAPRNSTKRWCCRDGTFLSRNFFHFN